MQGAPPLASPGLNPDGTGKEGEPRARRGLVPVGCQLTLPLWCPAGGLPSLPPAAPAISAPTGGLAFFLACQPCLWFTFLPPSPRPPFPSGEGEDQGFFHARGFAPCIPGAEPGRHLLSLPLWKTQRGLAPRGTGSPCPGGEDHLKRRRRLRRIVPLPRSPFSLATGTAHREPLPVGFAANREFLPPGTYMAGSVSAASGLTPGCRGRSPRRNKLKIPPSRWEGGRGDGGKKAS